MRHTPNKHDSGNTQTLTKPEKKANNKIGIFSKSGNLSAEPTKKTLINAMFPKLRTHPENIKKIADLLTHSFSSHNTPKATGELLLFFHKNLNAKEQTLALDQLSDLHQKLKDSDPCGEYTKRFINELKTRQPSQSLETHINNIMNATGKNNVTMKPALHFISLCDNLSIKNLRKGANLLKNLPGIDFNSKRFFIHSPGDQAKKRLRQLEPIHRAEEKHAHVVPPFSQAAIKGVF